MKVRSLLQTNDTIHSPSTSRRSGLCSHHEPGYLKSIFSAPRQDRIYDLGYIDDILSEPSCEFCYFIQSWIYKNEALFRKESSPIKCELCPQGSRFNEENDFGSSSEEAHHYDNFRLQATRIGYSSDGAQPPYHVFQLRGRQFLDTADMAVAQSWLKSCRETHGALCRSTKLQSDSEIFDSFRLVDVQTRVVVTIKSHVEYLALSYVWGGRQLQTFMSKKANSLDSSGRLVDLHLPFPLPATIEDAISVTKRLGFRYMWVDVVCIVQDGGNLKSSQISQMAQIFSSAVMTIAAAGGINVQAPIPGIQPQSRTPSGKIVPVDQLEVELLPVAPRSKASIEKCTWATRAWCFEERVLSKRCLIFTQDQMFFHCLQEARCEDTKEAALAPPNEIKNQHSRIYDIPKSIDDLYPLLSFLIQSYSQRRLSKAKDVLLAFGGIVSLLERSFHTKFIHGLPQASLHYVLLWQPYEALQIRINDGSMDGSAETPTLSDYSMNMKFSCLPTWTWAAWVGEIFFPEREYHTSDYTNTMKWQNSHAGCLPNCGLECPGQPDGKILRFATTYAKFNIKPLTGIVDNFEAGTLDWSNLQIEPNEEGSGYSKAELKNNSTTYNFLILDDDSKAAGEIILDQGLRFSENIKYSFLSICQCRTVKRTVWRSGWGGELDLTATENLETGELEMVEWKETEWSYVKVMMIEEDRSCAYRLGVGTIHKDAWNKQGLGSKDFQLA